MPAQATRKTRDDLELSQSRIVRGREILREEASALGDLCDRLDASFAAAVDWLLACQGNVVVTGMGKAGIVGQKISASLASTGTPSYFLHPGEAVHGDLGRLRSEDAVLLLSASGETEEITRLLPTLRDRAAGTLAITCRRESTLAAHVDLVLALGEYQEACSLGLAPSTSTTLMMAVGDALALVTSECRGFTSAQFAVYHPAGSLGKRLTNVKELMRPLSQCRVARETLSVREVIVQVSCPGRRTGAIMLTNEHGQLQGIFTDSDLARLLERGGTEQRDEGLDQPISKVMSREFQTVHEDGFFPEAIRKLTEFKISELPVIDEHHHPLGLIDITDLLDAALPTSLNETANASGRARRSDHRAGYDPRHSRVSAEDQSELGPRILSLQEIRRA